MANTLYYGDNLVILPRFIHDATIDLVYLDPPFNSNRDYNILFRDQSGEGSPSQIRAFTDTWNWAGASEAWDSFPQICPVPRVIELMSGFVSTLGKNSVTAYLIMMAPRLYQLHRVLKPTGSIYLHCDPTASHYLKILMDAVFGPRNFINEISWRRSGRRSSISRIYRRAHDVILCYGKTDNYFFNVCPEEKDETLSKKYTLKDDKGLYQAVPLMVSGRRNGVTGKPWRGFDPNTRGNAGMHWITTHDKLDAYDAQGLIAWSQKDGGLPRLKYYWEQNEGIPLSDFWDDIAIINSMADESLRYPTQKPLALLERIISASSNPGDLVLDPFCGCGTAVVAAQKLGRKWIGIDITPIATTLIQKRLWDGFRAKDARLLNADDLDRDQAFVVEGLPTDTDGARLLFEADHKKFEMWAVGLVPAIPQEKKGADKGIDGLAYFQDGGKKPSKAVVQVKGGHTGVKDVRDLRGVKERDGAALALFICLEAPTKPMRDEALDAGYYQPPIGGRKVQGIQILSIAELLSGTKFDLPFSGSNVTLSQARALQSAELGQLTLSDERSG